jgi:hypothetical protein
MKRRAQEFSASRVPPISEKEFQAQILQLARTLGWLCYHTFDSRRSQAGFPDLILIRGESVVFAEVKSEQGQLRAEQSVWLDALRAAGLCACVWRPGDWAEILRTLREGT